MCDAVSRYPNPAPVEFLHRCYCLPGDEAIEVKQPNEFRDAEESLIYQTVIILRNENYFPIIT